VVVVVAVAVVEVALFKLFNGVAVMRLIKAMSDSPGSCMKAGDANNADVDVVGVMVDTRIGEKAWLVMVEDNKTTPKKKKLVAILVIVMVLFGNLLQRMID
jgi:hypothetical protein